jgi:hypothetical protein
MSRVQRRICVLSVVFIVGIAGCSSEETTPTATAPPQTSAPAALAAPVLSPDVPQTPEAAVNAVVDGLKASKPIVVWNTLPDSGRHTLESLISSSAAGLDPEIWQRTVTNLKKLTTLLETKKDFILASPLWKSGRQLPKLDQVKATYDPLTKLLRTVVDSELVDQKKMSDFKGRAFLEGTGAKVFAEARALTKTLSPDPLAIIDTVKVTVTKQSDRFAKVEITRPNAKPTELGLTIVDGRWSSPQVNMVANFGGLVVMTYFEPFRPYQVVEWKANYLKDMDRLGKILDNLQAAKTSADFQDVVGSQLFMFALQKGAQFSKKQPPRTPTQTLSWERKANTTMVVVKGLHSFDEPTYRDLTKSLRAIVPEAFRGPLEVEGSTLFFIGPGDSIFDRTLKAIEVGKMVGKDKLRDTVTVELPTSLKDESSTAEAGAKTN